MNEVLKKQLEIAVNRYNNKAFIADDPIGIPHRFERKEDIEISGFLTALLAWGQRKTIINKANVLMKKMDNEPFLFITQAPEATIGQLDDFVHRTFNGDDCITLIHALRQIYLEHGGLETVFSKGFKIGGAYEAIEDLHQLVFSYPHLDRTRKHLARPSAGSAAKRINMFLRWMVRHDKKGVDFGLWNTISPSALICPLDVHSGNTARKLGLLSRKQNDWQAALELTQNLRIFDPNDPVKYDFALFGTGVSHAAFPYL